MLCNSECDCVIADDKKGSESALDGKMHCVFIW